MSFSTSPSRAHLFWAEVTGKPIIAAGKVTAINCILRDASERKRVEQLLRESEEEHRLLFQNSLSAVAMHRTILDATGAPVDYVFMNVNPAFERHTGLGAKKVVGRRITEVLPGIASTPCMEIFGKVATTGDSVAFEQYVEPLGAVLLRQCLPDYGRSTRHRVHGHHRGAGAEQALSQSERRLRTITDAAQDAILMMDSRGAISYWNPAAGALLGYSHAEAIGKNLHELLVPDRSLEACRAAFPGSFAPVAATPSARRSNSRPAARTAWRSKLLCRYRPCRSTASGTQSGFSAISPSANKWRTCCGHRKISFFANAPTCRRSSMPSRWECCWSTKTPRSLALNNVITDLVVRDASELVGRQPGDAFCCVHAGETAEGCGHSAACRDCPANAVERVLKVGQVIQNVDLTMRLVIEGQEQRHCFAMAATPLVMQGKKYALLALLDITERKRTEEQQRSTPSPWKVRNAPWKNSTAPPKWPTAPRAQFLANMSHEIRTPMTAILGYADLLAGQLDNPEQLEALDIIRRNGDHLLKIINDILDLSKIEAGKLQVEQHPVPRRRSWPRWFHSCECADAKGLTLQLEFAGPVPEIIWTDPARLRQILLNLIGNAIKFTETGGVRIVAQLIGGDTPEPNLVCEVVDTGIGMTAEQVKNLFQPFHQADV